MALLKACVLLLFIENAFGLLVPDSDGSVTEMKGDDSAKRFVLGSPISFAGAGDIETSIKELWVRIIETPISL